VAGDMKFLAELPAGYDSRTQLTLRDDNQVIVTHPEHPPLVLTADGQWLDLNEALVHRALGSSTC
jgi:hypothetical protein